MKQPKYICVIYIIDIVDEDDLVDLIQKRLGIESLIQVTINFKGDNTKGYNEMVSALKGKGSYSYGPKILDRDRRIENRTSLSFY